MEVKKNDKANIEKTKGSFFQLGLVIVLSLSLIAFEWTSGPRGDNEYELGSGELLDQEVIPRTVIEPEQAELQPEVPKITEIFEIVEDDIILENEVIFENLDVNIDDKIALYTYDIGEEVEEKEDDIFVIAEDMPVFRGGDQNKFAQWVLRNVDYPPEAAENGIYGKVYVEFVVDTDGSVSNLRITRPVDPALDREALRVVGNSPKWTPGKQLGIPVRIRFTITVNFQLQ